MRNRIECGLIALLLITSLGAEEIDELIDETSQPGLIGEYFKLEKAPRDFPKPGKDVKPFLVRVDGAVNFRSAGGEFYKTKLVDNFYVRWSGKLALGDEGNYSFFIESDDGSRLTIDGKVVVNNGGVHGMVRKSGEVKLGAGEHDLLIEFFEAGGGAGCIAGWKPPGGKEEPFPHHLLSHRESKAKIAWEQKAWASYKIPAPRHSGGGKTYTSVEEATADDPDFLIQGEYSGELIVAGKARKSGVQVIADGDGRFQAVLYPGGLPGEGWVKEEGKARITGTLGKEGAVEMKGEAWSAKISKGVMTVLGKDGKESGTLKRTERESQTLGKKPLPGAIVLFDGVNPDNFENGRMTDDNLLWCSTKSKRLFQDHFVHIEFRTPYKPFARGQGRGNSGVYLQQRFEVQVLDSFGLEGKNNECGGLYSVAEPKVNMCFPPLRWQTYDVEFKAPRWDENGKKVSNATLTVHHNGVLVHDKVEVRGGTRSGRAEGASAGPLYLQGHGNPVVYRNIWVIER
jgi:hypothetical protein